MAGFFLILTILIGLLKFIFAAKNGEIQILDVIALGYAILVLIAAVIYYFNTGKIIFDEL